MWNRVNNGRGGGGNGGGGNPSNRPVCQFFLDGRCKFGDSCHNYHPPQGPSSGSNQNRFGALSGSSQAQNQPLPFGLNVDSIKADLTVGDEKPGWPLSCYGPGRDAPRQLIEGALEQSPEELRVQYYLAKASGSTQSYEQNEREALAQAEQQARQILGDIDGAVQFVVQAKDQHPSRLDVVTQNAANFPASQPSTAVSNTTSGTSAFGRPSAMGTTSTSGTAFGQPTAPGTASAFGKPSAFGAKPTLGAPATGGNVFGQPANGGAAASGSAFGQPSAMASTFGKPSALSGGTAFGQSSSLGSTASPFGGGGNISIPFGQAAANASNSTPSFGQQSANNANSGTSAFGKPSGLGGQGMATNSTTPSNPSPFGASSTAPVAGSGFGRPSTMGQQSAFGTASSLGTGGNTNSTSAFGQPSAMRPQPSPFGANQPAPSGTAFGQPSNLAQANPPFGTNNSKPFTQQQPTTSLRAPGTPLTNFKGRAVEYLRLNPDDPSDQNTAPFYMNAQGRPERIWMPDGAPGPNADVEGPPAAYEGAMGNLLRQIYEVAQQSDLGFRDGFVPEVPPKREWVSFEL